jgi:hypothetical protein
MLKPNMHNQLKPEIKIWDSIGLGLIINYPTGVFVSNQTGGTACLQSSIEGIYLPLANDYSIDSGQFTSPEIDLINYFTGKKYGGHGAIDGIDNEDVKNITDILTKYGLNDCIKVDLNKLKKSHEAWIHVIILGNNNLGLFSNFDETLSGILTWSNSD